MRLQRVSEFSLHRGFMEEFGLGNRESHMFLMEFPRMLQHLLARALEEKQQHAPKKRKPTSNRLSLD